MKKKPFRFVDPHTTYVLGFTEILVVAGVLLFFFGAKRIPEIAKGLGGGIRSFKTELKEGTDDPDQLPPPDDRDPNA